MLALPYSIYADENKKEVPMYQLDMFSLISFSLAITALVVSLFMAWLSWEFYKKSSETSEKTNSTVTRVESSILEIKNNISEIVQRAVGYWIEGGGGNSDILNTKDELYEKFGELEEKLRSVQGGAPEVSDEIAILKDQINDLSLGVRQAQIRSLFPNIKDESPAIQHNQSIILREENKQHGQLIISLNKPIPYASATGKFQPRMSTVPDFEVNLISSPYDNNNNVKFSKGVGTPNDFNIHINGKGEKLKIGNYVFEYTATINNKK